MRATSTVMSAVSYVAKLDVPDRLILPSTVAFASKLGAGFKDSSMVFAMLGYSADLTSYYALGAGNGAVPDGCRVSSFTFEPPWQSRPMPSREKYVATATDKELGFIA